MDKIDNEAMIMVERKMRPPEEARQEALMRDFPGAEIVTAHLGGGLYAEHCTIEGLRKALVRIQENFPTISQL